jgi:hypothetical protein
MKTVDCGWIMYLPLHTEITEKDIPFSHTHCTRSLRPHPRGALCELCSCAIIHTHLVNDPHFLISKVCVLCDRDRHTPSATRVN